MHWFLVLGGGLLLVLGFWGGPRRRGRVDKSERIPKDATVQEAWEILTSPVNFEDEAIRIPDHKPAFGERRFNQGLLTGLGAGLLLFGLLFPFLAPDRPAPAPPVASDPPAPAAAAQPPTVQSPAPVQAPPVVTPPAPPAPTKVTFVIEPGAVASQVAADLKTAGLIEQELAFLDLLKERGAEQKLQYGAYLIPTDISLADLITKLTVQ